MGSVSPGACSIGIGPKCVDNRKTSPSTRHTAASAASHSCAAFSAIALITARKSAGERAIMRRTSPVAASRSSASSRSRLSCSFSPAVALSRRKDSARSRLRASSCWRNSAIVCASFATDVFTFGRRGVVFLFLELFLDATKTNPNRWGNRRDWGTPWWQASPAVELTFTSGGGWRQRGIFKVASLALWPEKGGNLKPFANAKAKIPLGLNRKSAVKIYDIREG